MTQPTIPDFRPQLAQAQEWVATLIDGVRTDQLDAPTPCDGWTVRDLLEHLFAVEERLRLFTVTGDVTDAATELPLPDGDLGQAFRAAARTGLDAWADDAMMSREVIAPWGKSPGAAAVAAYAEEHVAHGWDLAIATGQPAEADPALAQAALGIAKDFIPADIRGQIPFGEVIEPADGAGPTEQLAKWLGRARP